MKKVAFGILFSILLIFTGCLNDDDHYSLGDQWLGFGVIQDEESLRMKMDNGDILRPVAANYYYFETREGLAAGDRVLVNFTILDELENDTADFSTYYIKINSLEEKLLKQIIDITPENEDSIGNDPIVVHDVWMANDLLNFKLKYWGQYETHFINLVKQPGDLSAAEQPVQLELRHNSNNDIESIPYTDYVSFHLDSLFVPGLDSIQFDVICEDYDGEPFVYEGTYVYGNND